LLVALLVSAGSSPAWSQAAPDHGTTVVKVRVPIGDLDLSQAAGADAFLARVAHAAARACAGKPAVGVLIANEARAYHACKESTLSQAVAQLGSPLVQQRYAEDRGDHYVKVAARQP
jgi:UrcA family protein